MAPFELQPVEYLPQPPKGRNDYQIGIIGCGSIVHHAHLPAYQKAGYQVVACCDLNPDALQQTQSRWGIEKGTTDYRQILEDPEVEIVDIAIHQAERKEIVIEAAQAGKHILLQKPFAHTLYAAKAMVEAAEQAGVKLMINQQARYAPAHKAITLLIERGAIGRVYQIEHRVRGNQDVRGYWYIQMPWGALVDHGVHYIDLCRWWAGERVPERVATLFTYMPGQYSQYPMQYEVLLEFDPYLGAAHSFNNVTRIPGWHTFIRIEGTEGAIESDGSTVKLFRAGEPDPVWEHQTEGSWFPDAFMGTMAELMDAITEDREPWLSGRHNLQTLATVFAAVDSYRSGTFVKPTAL